MAALKRLLLANDEMAGMVGMNLLVESLKKKDIEVVLVGNADDAIAALKAKKFDLIITDIDFKTSKTGIDLIKEIRKLDKTVKIIVATGFGDWYKEQAMAAGANDYFEKPLYIEEHILKPLGIAFAPIQKSTPQVKQDSLRSVVHELYNKQGYAILVSSLLRENLEEYLKEHDDIPAEPRKLIKKSVADLAEVEETVKAADSLLKRVRNKVYTKLDPDKEIVE